MARGLGSESKGKAMAGLWTGSRRGFLKDGAIALVGTFALPGFLRRAVLAQSTNSRGRKLVVVFQRGAADGLNMVVPHGEPDYYRMRPSLAIPKGQAIDLDGFFGLHPAMAPLQPLFSQGHLAIVHAAGSPDPTRSHFDAQDYMENGTPGVKATPDGWLNRALRAEKPGRGGSRSPFRAVALGPRTPRTLEGSFPAVTLDRLADFRIQDSKAGGDSRSGAPLSAALQAMYAGSRDPRLRSAGRETFAAIEMLRAADPARYAPAPGADYPNTPFGSSMRQIAQLLKGDFGVEAAFTDIGGWDTHHNQGGVSGQLANRLADFSRGIAAFWTDLGAQAEGVVLATLSEFGRTAQQNGTGGTDHGHANAMFVLGGAVRGGKVYGRWPGLAPEQLHEGRDLAITTDFRQILAEAVYRTLDARDLDLVFPGAGLRPARFLSLI